MDGDFFKLVMLIEESATLVFNTSYVDAIFLDFQIYLHCGSEVLLLSVKTLCFFFEVRGC